MASPVAARRRARGSRASARLSPSGSTARHISISRRAARRPDARGLYHEIAGDGDPVVLIHAGLCDSRMWDPQWRTFPLAHRALRYDIRGFGRSPIDGPPISLARDLTELLDAVGFERASLVGVSLGGRIALEAAVARPDRMEKLVLVGTGLPGHEWSDEVRRFGEAEDGALERGDVEEAVELNLRMWVDGPRRAPDEVDPAVRELVREMQRRAFELQLPFADVEEEYLVPDLADRVAEIHAPVLLVVGEEDVADIHQIADRLERSLPNVSRASIPGTAHLPSLERPDEFDSLVLPFLAARRP